MANIVWLESAGCATYGLEFWSGTEVTGAGQVLLDATTVRLAHQRSLELKSAAGGTARVYKNDILQTAGNRISVWIYLDTTPGTPKLMFYVEGAAHEYPFSIYTTNRSGSTFKLYIHTSNGTESNNSTTTFSSGVWYYITLAYTITSTSVNECRLYVNGVLDISLSNASLVSTTCSHLSLVNGDNSQLLGAYFSDIYVDDGTDLAFPGIISVMPKLPAAHGTKVVGYENFDTAVGSNPANRWTNVNERALSALNGWSQTLDQNQEEVYLIQSPSAGDVDTRNKTVLGRLAWVYANKEAAYTSSPEIYNNGTLVAAAIASASPLIYFNVATGDVYPDHVRTIGLRRYAASGGNLSLYECGMLLAYLDRDWGGVVMKLINGLA